MRTCRGLGAIEQFKRKGFDVMAYEARDSVGGLWSVKLEWRACILYADICRGRNFDPTPPPCRISFDEDGHTVALTDLERSGLWAPTPTPMYAGVTANTPRVRV